MDSRLNFKLVDESLSYNSENGILKWKIRPRDHFSTKRLWKAWNARYSEKFAGTVNSRGYIAIKLFDKTDVAHRFAWLLHFGFWPDNQIDHISGDKLDNRITNLRDVSASQNQRNAKLRSDNTSGICGVYWSSKTSKWKAQIRIDGKCLNLGCFLSKNAAIRARKFADLKHGFDQNHGKIRSFAKQEAMT